MKRFVALFLVIAILAPVVLPLYALAGYSEYFDIVSSVPTYGVGESYSSEIEFKTSEQVHEYAEEACNVTAVISAGNNALKQGPGIVGADAQIIATLQAQAAAIVTAQTCVSVQIGTRKASLNLTYGISHSSQILAKIALLQSQLETLKTLANQIDARLYVAHQNFWKAILIAVMLNTSNKAVEVLVTKLSDKFKINNIAGYVNAIADTVHTNDVILSSNVPGKEQMAIRAILNNPILRQKISPVAINTAQAAAGFDINQPLSYSDPTFLDKVAKLGTYNGDVFNENERLKAQATRVQDEARRLAELEVAQGAGYKSAYKNCSQNFTSQKQQDAAYQSALDEREDRQALVTSLENALKQANLSDADKAKLEADLAKAKADYEAVNNRVVRDNSPLTKTLLNICEGVNAPADKLKETINQLIGTQIKHFTDFKTENLSYFQNLIVGLSSSLINKYIFNGSQSGSEIIKEGVRGAVSGGITLAEQQIAENNAKEGNSGPGPGPLKTPLIYYSRDGDGPLYTINIDGIIAKGEASMKITSPNIGGTGNNEKVLTVADGLGIAYQVAITTKTTISVEIYDANKKVLATASVTIVPVGAVKGVSTNRASIVSPRVGGPLVYGPRSAQALVKAP